MKRQLINFLGAGALAAGMAFAQTSAAPEPSNEPGNQPYAATQGTEGQTQSQTMQQRRIDRLTRELNLNASQRSQARSIFSEARQSSQPIRAQLKENSQALQAAVRSDNRGQIDALSAKQGSLVGQMLGIHNRADAKFYQTLNSDQRVKYDQMQQQTRARIHNRMQQKQHPAS
jgi:Spy/CpxP family protein refolding chaperone